MVGISTRRHHCDGRAYAQSRSFARASRRRLRGRAPPDKDRGLQRQLGRLEGRLELTERTESTLREDLERERRQCLEEVQRERAERLEAQKAAEVLERDRIRLERERFYREARQTQLEDAPEAERSKGFWARLFSG